MNHRMFALSGSALFLLAVGCASSDDVVAGDDADITATSHGDAVAACVKTEEQGLADSDLYGVIAAHEKGEACLKKANDKTIAQINKRRGQTVATDRFNAFRTAQANFCDAAPNEPIPPTTSGTAIQAGCKRDAEYNLAMLLQLNGQLGGSTTMCARVTKCIPRPLAMDRCLASVESAYTWNGPVSKLDTCLSTEVTSKATSYASRASAATIAKAFTASQSLCDAITYKAGQDAKTRESATGVCRTNAASVLYNSLVASNEQ